MEVKVHHILVYVIKKKLNRKKYRKEPPKNLEEGITICDINVAANWPTYFSIKFGCTMILGVRENDSREGWSEFSKERLLKKKWAKIYRTHTKPMPVSMKISYRDPWGSEKRPHL